MKKPTILTHEQMRPGMEVEQHLRKYGHLPEDGCCDKVTTPQERIKKLVGEHIVKHKSLPYSKIDHTHCPKTDSPCGMKGEHRCCLCGEPSPHSVEVR